MAASSFAYAVLWFANGFDAVPFAAIRLLPVASGEARPVFSRPPGVPVCVVLTSDASCAEEVPTMGAEFAIMPELPDVIVPDALSATCFAK